MVRFGKIQIHALDALLENTALSPVSHANPVIKECMAVQVTSLSAFGVLMDQSNPIQELHFVPDAQMVVLMTICANHAFRALRGDTHAQAALIHVLPAPLALFSLIQGSHFAHGVLQA